FTTLAKEQDVLDVVLYDAAGLVRLSIEASTIPLGLHGAVSNLVPQNRLQAIKTKFPGAYLNVGVKGHNVVLTALFARDADITHHATDPPAANENALALAPYAVQVGEETLVIPEMAHLVIVTRRIFLQRPIG